MENWVRTGYAYARKNISTQTAASAGDQYIQNICDAIQNFNDDINQFSGYKTQIGQLQGDIAEFWHGNTFNINATVNDSNYRVSVNRSHGYASPDINSNWGDKYGLKYYKNGIESVKEQSKSHFQRYCEYKAASGRKDLGISEFLSQRGLNDDSILNDPIYSGQMRLIPYDQYEAAIEYLKLKIAKESLIRPEQVKRYQDTLNLLTSKINAPDGTTSIELSRETSEQLAQIAKDGKFDAAEYGFTTEQLVHFQHALKIGVKAGTSAAIISLVLKTAPELYKCLTKLIREGSIDSRELQNIGFAALNGVCDGFIRGFVAGTLTTACESGMLGESLKDVNPGCIAALTVILVQAMKDSYLVVKGDITHYELIANISKNIFITSCGLGLGLLFQALAPAIPFAYMLGNFVGSFVGSFIYISADNAFISFAIYSGWTFFGVVDQDYTLPDEVMKEIGMDVFKYEKYEFDEFQIDEYQPDFFVFDEYQPHFIKLIKRGVIGVHQIGYIQA